MAQKRMFDRAIIDTDKFMDLPMSAKALYFLLGMEADDEGFVSYKKVVRVHGGNEDDVKVLIAKNFLIHFPSGVVVITDWHQNNWLDNRRIRETSYQEEKKMLILTEDKKYSLSNGLASIEENRIEQYRIEENRIEESKETPSQIAREFFKNPEDAIQVFLLKGFDENILRNEIAKFILYWTEPNKSGTKQRWELEKTFEINRRLATWFNNVKNFNKNNSPDGMPKGIEI